MRSVSPFAMFNLFGENVGRRGEVGSTGLFGGVLSVGMSVPGSFRNVPILGGRGSRFFKFESRQKGGSVRGL